MPGTNVIPPSDTPPNAFGPYRLIGEIGRGAMGIVYEAEDTRLERRVALKLLHPGLGQDDMTRQRFQREARACARVDHRHIVKIHEAGDVQGQLYYAMAILEGASLQDALQLEAESTLTHEAIFEGLADIADALQALHDAGIIHRDVKPANIMVDQDGNFVLSDFGLARSVAGAALTDTGEFVGTPLYMAPEQISGEPEAIDGRADVYALGVTLYEALTGAPPFGATTDVPSVIRRVLQERIEAPSHVRPGLGRDIDRVVLQSTEKLRTDRHQTADALAADLRALARGDPVDAHPVPAWVRGLRWMRRRPWVPAGVAALAVVFWLLARGPLTATLQIATVPEGEVALEDGPFHATPYRVERDPGPIALRLRAPGFALREVTYEAIAGENRIEYGLTLADAGDVDALRRLAEARGFTITPLDGKGRMRGVGVAAVQLLFPRGRVRPQDLRTWRVDLGPTYDEDASTIAFRAGDKDPVEIPFDPAELITRRAMPNQFLGELTAGIRGEWRWRSADGKRTTKAAFEVVTPALDERLTAIDALATGENGAARQPASVRGYLRCQVLLEHGLDQAAFLELEALWGNGVRSRALVEMQIGVLRRLFAGEPQTLASLSLRDALHLRLDGFGR